MYRLAGYGLCFIVLVLAPGATVAQLSPGELHQSHAFLEGVQNCSKCHGSDRQLVPDNCLACHSAIRERLDSRTGLHGRQEYRQCQLCHVEHQGRTFDLVYWKEGQKQLDHSQTGYRLEGKHATADCRACHQEKFIMHRAALETDKTTLDRTFLGLDSACKSCHFDEHRGQLMAACSECHTAASWKPPTGFDHTRTRFTLQGKHTTVLCEKCHLPVVDNSTVDDGKFLRLSPLVFQQCTDCHTDPHKGRLGANCTNCHSADGWNVTNKANFDHSKTRYPLEGKHAGVACDKCHIPGRERAKLPFAVCRDCHTDFHNKEFAARPSKGACEECHTVAGYSPARFLMAQHEQTKYPLTGAHKAVPCSGCHAKRASGTETVRYQFKFKSMRCVVCHGDPHRGEAKKYVTNKGCEFCHSEETWRQVRFDHGLTRFALEGKHSSVDCRKCHTGRVKGVKEPALTMIGAATVCSGCHQDIHLGQFAAAGSNVTDCAGCHTPQDWKARKFDHNRQSRFKLDGAHIRVPCQKCHRPIMVGTEPFVAYKPLDTACASCHGATPVLKKENKT
ncbi:MAG: hypothetical protein AB1644_12045 [Candidatus Zixiibacteriota bacterium]